VYPPAQPRDVPANVNEATAPVSYAEPNLEAVIIHPRRTGGNFQGVEAELQVDHGELMLQLGVLRGQTIPRKLGVLGELEPVSTPLELGFVFDQIRDSPLIFADQGGTMFIHKDLFSSLLPARLRTAFCICAGAVSMSESRRHILFKVINAEMSDILAEAPASTLPEQLARLQAAVLYQIIRFFQGNLEQRILAERQEFEVRSYALRLLQLADMELRQVQPNWECWVFTESIRRTVFIAFKIYTLYWSFKFGTCIETAAMRMLPVSAKPSSWVSREVYLQNTDRDRTTTYGDYTTDCVTAPRPGLEAFERLLLTACTGVEDFTASSACPNLRGLSSGRG
jgi:hypothetical protein